MDLQTQPAPLHGTALEAEQLLPNVPLREAATGRDWRPSELRQRSALILAFLHAGCEACHRLVGGLAELTDEIRGADAQVRIVLPEDDPEAGPFPVVLDPDGRARDRMLGPDGQVPTLLVADRYTAVMQSFPAPEHRFPDPADVVSTLHYVACDCS